MRFIDELFNPILKCFRVGHKHRAHTSRVFLMPWRAKQLGVRFSADHKFVEVEQYVDRCPRCQCIHHEHYSLVAGLQALPELDHYDWYLLRKSGEVTA